MARRLAAILAADVVGYSRLMAEDETGTLSALKAHRSEIFDPEIDKRNGRIVKLMGDGAREEFASVVDAVESALAIQRALASERGKISLRIGINLGDVIIEGDDIYLRDNLDIVVTDGFVGNVALKNTEGVAKLIRHFMAAEFKRNLLTKLSGIIALPVLKALRRRIDPRRYNGASLLGLRGIVVKSHGGADALAFRSAIAIAKKEVLADIADRIEQRVAQQLDVSKSA